MKLRHVTLLLCVLGSWLAVAAAHPAAFQKSGGHARVAAYPTYELKSPTGNIHCYVSIYGPREGSSMRCLVNRVARTVPRPSNLDGCDWTGGRWFTLVSTHAGERFAPCDAVVADGPPLRLAYGRVWRRGPFACLSTRIAFICVNRQGHGLYLSFQKQFGF
jgi:hypothetical protein